MRGGVGGGRQKKKIRGDGGGLRGNPPELIGATGTGGKNKKTLGEKRELGGSGKSDGGVGQTEKALDSGQSEGAVADANLHQKKGEKFSRVGPKGGKRGGFPIGKS